MVLTTESYKMMGTHVTLQITHPNAKSLLKHAHNILIDLEKRFNANDNASNLMKINQNAGKKAVRVDDDLFYLIKIGKMYSIASLLNLNIAIGPLVKLWRIGFKDARRPSDQEINAVLELIDPQKIHLNEEKQTVYLSRVGMEIDLGALAKGYFADILKDFFISKGVKHGIINLGGNVLTIGDSNTQPDHQWRVGIQRLNRNRGDILGAVKVVDESVVTSGIYERCLNVDGKTYHHILDSRTGFPIFTEIGSISIISKTSLDCEIWATILFHNTCQEAIGHINNTPGIEGVVVDLDENVYLSAGLHHRFIARD
ncbi:FAD:protein FMN transferase [Ignavigranum ruoffiae]|uniref:FAD:protein FMN transferase n=2 Tax=Ignavigranum ruoffiae TaxID=89093 RepID=A0A1H9CTW6_9LACT|nr:FAD:protein FMN transferase [Ignavigranum ruoffiae]SEQ04581.1 thiamine biosynthesis lipoprotein [Ignavigranum ruoffiae]